MARYTLTAPFEISARLMPAIKVAGATLSIDYGDWTRDGRMQWDVWIDLPDTFTVRSSATDARLATDETTFTLVPSDWRHFNKLSEAQETARKLEAADPTWRGACIVETHKYEYQISDMRSGVGGSPLIEAFRSLLAFLGAAAESRNYRDRRDEPEVDPDSNEALFAPAIVDWAAENSDEISSAECDLEGEAGELALQEG